MHTREHAIATNTDFRGAARRDMETGWHVSYLHDSCRSDGTWQNQQGNAHSGSTGGVSGRASAEVLGAVDLLSLRAASWTRPPCLEARCGHLRSFPADGCPAKFCKSELCSCTKLADAAVCGVSADIYLHSDPDTTSSMAGRADRDLLQCIQRPAVSSHCKVVPKSSKSAARSSLYTNRAGPQPTFRGRERNPTCIKQWAALTTWLRMNLHQARTAKRQVCFVGQMSASLERWVFDLNPKLPWNEVSPETKQRLRTLPREAEQAFAHKYPFRNFAGWQEKAVKYKPGNLTEAHNILLGDLVDDLHSLYLKHELINTMYSVSHMLPSGVLAAHSRVLSRQDLPRHIHKLS